MCSATSIMSVMASIGDRVILQFLESVSLLCSMKGESSPEGMGGEATNKSHVQAF